VVAEEESHREHVDGAQGDGRVLVRHPGAHRPRPPRSLAIHPVDGDGACGGGADFAGEDPGRRRR
jgi:hypothetical protein